jgi:hypothetical protein
MHAYFQGEIEDGIHNNILCFMVAVGGRMHLPQGLPGQQEI